MVNFYVSERWISHIRTRNMYLSIGRCRSFSRSTRVKSTERGKFGLLSIGRHSIMSVWCALRYYRLYRCGFYAVSTRASLQFVPVWNIATFDGTPIYYILSGMYEMNFIENVRRMILDINLIENIVFSNRKFIIEYTCWLVIRFNHEFTYEKVLFK